MKTTKRLYSKPPIKTTLNNVGLCDNNEFCSDSFCVFSKSARSFAVHQHHHHLIH